MKKILIYTTSIIVISYFIIYLFYNGILWFNNPSKDEYPIRGIDISHHQGDIDWIALRTEKFDFVFIKATEGGDFVDKKFHNNWKSAIEEGYVVGAYHFYRLCTSWRLQADNIIKTVPKEINRLPIVLDLEFVGNCLTHKSNEDIRIDIRALIDSLQKHYGRKPLLYVTEEFYERYMVGYFDDMPLWYRNIFTKPSLGEDKSWLFWQYSNRGRLNGIDGFVDENVFYSDKRAFEEYLR